MKKEDAFNEEFLKQFKNGEELYSFLGQLQKRGVEAILEGEMDLTSPQRLDRIPSIIMNFN